ncbi:MAG TPA: DUF916 domain-containing protein [Solirubrobacteraceae bacterium]|nr:DUF916 domain-containing protein [Solirubrobacteraceae bacterium]
MNFTPRNRGSARKHSLLAASLLIAWLSLAGPAWASSPAVFVQVHQTSGLVSPYFQLKATPGRTVTAGSLQVTNPGSHPVTVQLAPVNALTTNTLGSAYDLSGTAVQGSTTWLRLSRQSVTIAPHSSQSVAVALDVPASAAPGDYLAGVSVQALGQVQTTDASHGVAIGEIDRYAIGVETTLPGPRYPAIHFTGASVTREPAGLAFLVAASNTGNVILKNVHGWVKVTSGHRQVTAATIAPGTFVSDTSISYPLLSRTEQPTPGSTYRVQAALFYPGGVARLDQTVTFSHAAAVKQQNYGGRKLPQSNIPWLWILLALGLVILANAVAVLLVRRRRPLSRAAGMALLERVAGPDGNRPVSLALVSCSRRAQPAVAAVIRRRLRKSDRICRLGSAGLLVICPATTRRTATALEHDFYEHLARDPQLADTPITITRATAVKPTTARKLVQRVIATRWRDQRELESAAEPVAPNVE